jgi:hypothetical protein
VTEETQAIKFEEFNIPSNVKEIVFELESLPRVVLNIKFTQLELLVIEFEFKHVDEDRLIEMLVHMNPKYIILELYDPLKNLEKFKEIFPNIIIIFKDSIVWFQGKIPVSSEFKKYTQYRDGLELHIKETYKHFDMPGKFARDWSSSDLGKMFQLYRIRLIEEWGEEDIKCFQGIKFMNIQTAEQVHLDMIAKHVSSLKYLVLNQMKTPCLPL